MIQLLRHHEIDRERWAACLRKSPQALIYVQYWYLEVVCDGYWEALVEIQEEEYVSLFPLPVRTLLGRKKVYQPLFSQQLGLVVTSKSQHLLAGEYLSKLPTHYAQVYYQLPWLKKEPIALSAPWQWRYRPNYELCLAPGYDLLYQQYSTNLRRNLKKAAKVAFEMKATSSIEPLLELFQRTKGKELTNLRHRHYQKLHKLYRQAQVHRMGQVWEVWQQHELLCAAFILHTACRTTFLFGASSEQGRKVHAMSFLLDQLIQGEAGSGKVFDFEGSEVPGVAKFYAGFGAQSVSYLSLSIQPNFSVLQWITSAFTFLAKRLR